MFTGLIAELGTVDRLVEGSASCKLSVRARKIMENLKIGDSVAVNGVCLTVVSLQSGGFTADVMPETVRRTTFRELVSGSPVNLEKALRPADGLDGHIVAGHVEGVGTISSIKPEGNALVYWIKAPRELLRYVVEKGSIAIDGISLTVVGVDGEGFGVSLIPHTAKVTTLGGKAPGSHVNLETDILARYVERLLLFPKEGKGPADAGQKESGGGLTLEFLQKNGF